MRSLQLLGASIVVWALRVSTAFAQPTVDFRLDRIPANQASKSTYTSPVITSAGPMDRAVASWNADTPGQSALAVDVRARVNGRWSRWFAMGEWGQRIHSHSVPTPQNADGRVDIDTLELKAPATQWQYRVRNLSAGTDRAALRAVALAWKNSATFQKSDAQRQVVAQMDLPAVSQFATGARAGVPELGARICSATSVAMLLGGRVGLSLDPLQLAAAVYDHAADAYGNWSFNVAVLATYLPSPQVSYMRWYDSFDDLLMQVERNGPVVVSIGFKDGELTGAPKPTPGHLVVVRGADARHVYVNDPAAPNDQTVARRYDRTQFVRAWKGVAYVVE